MIAVTGTGGGIGQSILKCLAQTSYPAVAIDPDPLAVGLYAAPVAYLGPLADEDEFIEKLRAICVREGCSLLFPGIEPELQPVSAHRAVFREAGIVPVVSGPDVIRICDDKQATAKFLVDSGFCAPTTETFVDDVDSSWFPFVLKPRHGGARSARTYVVTNRSEFDVARRLIDPENCVVQEFIEGDEYTCGSVTFDGVCRGVIAMRRTLRDGDTYKAFVVRNAGIESYVAAAANALKPFGACNFQLRVRGGEPYIFEINARCSGTTYARALAGFNEPKMVADFVLHGILPTFTVREITVLRYWSELVVEQDVIAELAQKRTLRRDGDTL